VSKDRVERIWRREGLKVPQKQKPRGRLWLNDGSCVRLWPERPNQGPRQDQRRKHYHSMIQALGKRPGAFFPWFSKPVIPPSCGTCHSRGSSSHPAGMAHIRLLNFVTNSKRGKLHL